MLDTMIEIDIPSSISFIYMNTNRNVNLNECEFEWQAVVEQNDRSIENFIAF